MYLPIYQIDAFTSQIFAGNPAAVVPLDRWPDDELLQAIAAENNLAETAFIVPETGGWELRWFTPALEVALCGHATLATAHALRTELGADGQQYRFSTRRSGILTVNLVEDGAYQLDFPAIPIEPNEQVDFAERALGARPNELYYGSYAPNEGDYLAVFADQGQVAALTPDFGAFNLEGGRGIIASAPGQTHDFVSRYFAPNAGIEEDPVTGSAHCVLAPYWAAELGKSRLRAQQISERGGEMICEVDYERVRLTGNAVTYLRGEINVSGAQRPFHSG